MNGDDVKPKGETAIIVDDLIKNFEVSVREPGLIGGLKSVINPQKKKVRALKGITFKINEGELVGFIGPNGAGKTTTLKTLSGLLYPSAGFVQVLGHDPWQKNFDFLKKISLVMGQKNQLWWDLPAIETFELNRVIYGMSTHDYQESLHELVGVLGVEKYLNVPVRKLSLGQRMRLELVAALLHRPKILFLDEPTLGLDVLAQQKVRDFIYHYNKKYKATVLLTSHNMSDLLDLAKRVIVIDKGEIVFDGELDELIGMFAKRKTLKVYFSEEIDIKKLEGIGKLKKFDYPVGIISVERDSVASAASELLQNLPVKDLTIEEEPIEDIIRKVFKKISRKKLT